MIETLTVRNFRCFRDLNLSPLKQFNIIVGDSASGKTALLEAIFLLSSGSPEVWMRLRQWRGASNVIRLTGTRASYESIFRDMFFNFDKKKGANFRLVSKDGTARSLDVQYPKEQRYAKRTASDLPGEENAYIVDPIVFHWTSRGKVFKSKVDIKEGAIKFSGFNAVYPAWFSSPSINDAATIAPFFSELSLKNKARTVIEAVKELFPIVQDITLESIVGEPTLCLSLESLSEKVPIGSISSGLNKYVSIMVAAAANPGGTLLLDEFEVGFYYKMMPALLESIFSFCQKLGVQVFATTHSYEFLQALVPAMKSRQSDEGDTPDFALLRSQRQKGESAIKILGNPVAAIESGFEVR
jgi:AAA15 family ATPase/GTPase